MRWEAWVLVITIVLSTLMSIKHIGEPREPLSPGVVSFVALFNIGFVVLILRLAEVL